MCVCVCEKAKRMKAFELPSDHCRICSNSLRDLPPAKPGSIPNTLLRVFACGHGFHDQCLDWNERIDECPICSEKMSKQEKVQMEEATSSARHNKKLELETGNMGNMSDNTTQIGASNNATTNLSTLNEYVKKMEMLHKRINRAQKDKLKQDMANQLNPANDFILDLKPALQPTKEWSAQEKQQLG